VSELLMLAVLAFAIGIGATYVLAHPESPVRWMDEPNARSLHEVPTPRGGGLAIVVAVAVGALVMAVAGIHAGPAATSLGVIAVTAIAISIVSMLDDARGVAARWRLAVHVLGAVTVVGWFGVPEQLALPGRLIGLDLGWLLMAALLVVALVWMTNLYNFMDGMDGFAGGMTVVGFATLGWLGSEAGDLAYASVCAMIAAAGLGFLGFNFPPARIFMGDVGSATLGFLAGALIVVADTSGLFPWWVGVMAFGVFVIDASVTISRRALNRERVWEAHRTHFYQRMVGCGWSHKRTVVAAYVLMLLSSGGAIVAAGGGAGTESTVAWVLGLTYTAVMILVTVAERRRSSQ
jgi:UDP-N-acetylmuramyl pentapeptide phosphotransferase/UDP-N-acetylglucosamine-1-phosphate transferase